MLFISLRQYEYVCAIGHHGSLTAAAEHLNVSQPALSAALARIEQHLGYPLFIRKRGSAMAVTPQGRTFIEGAKSLLDHAARLQDPSHPPIPSKRLRLGCFVDLAPFLLAPAIRRLRSELPDVEVTYRADGFEALLAALLKGQIDIALTYDLGMDAGFSRRLLYVCRPNALIPPDHPLATHEVVILDRLAEFPLILSEEGLSAQYVLELFRRKGLSPHVAHRATSLEILRSLAAHGEGVGISYANPVGALSYDGLPIASRPVRDPEARESVVIARHGIGPADPLFDAAQRVLAVLFEKN